MTDFLQKQQTFGAQEQLDGAAGCSILWLPSAPDLTVVPNSKAPHQIYRLLLLFIVHSDLAEPFPLISTINIYYLHKSSSVLGGPCP